MHVRPMNSDMTPGTALIMWVNHAVRRMVGISDAAGGSHTEVAVAGVALQAKLGDRGPDELLGICGTVGPVAADAAIDFAGLMLKYERPTLVHMTFETRLLTRVRLIEHLRGLSHSEGRSKTAVRIMTIAARHEALVHTMFEGQVEL